MCLIYTFLVAMLFKLKILKVRPYPIAWCTLVGVLLIGAIVVFWHLDAPMSSRVVTTQYVVQLVPYIKGQVKKVCAQANQPIKKGNLLLEIDPAPYQATVNQMEAQLAVAKADVGVKQAALKAAVAKAGAAVKQADAAVKQSDAALMNA